MDKRIKYWYTKNKTKIVLRVKTGAIVLYEIVSTKNKQKKTHFF